MATIFRVKNFDRTPFTYSKVVSNQYGGKVVYINTPDRKQVRLQTPKMRGYVQKWQNKDAAGAAQDAPKYTLKLSFGYEPAGVTQQFRDILGEWDKDMIKMAQDNCADWFRKKAGTLTEDVASDMYCPMLKKSIDSETLEEDGKFPDSVAFKITSNEDGTISGDITIYDEEQNEITNLEEIPRGSAFIAIVKCSGVWFAAGKYGISWRLEQMQVFRPQRISGFSIMDDLDGDVDLDGAVGNEVDHDGDVDNDGDVDQNDDAPAEDSAPEEEPEADALDEDEASTEVEAPEADADEEPEAAEEAEEPEADAEAEAEEPEAEEPEPEVEEEPEPEPEPEPTPEKPKKKGPAAAKKATATKKAESPAKKAPAKKGGKKNLLEDF